MWPTKLLFVILLAFQWSQHLGFADESAAAQAPAFDLSALANLATNLGTNPQIVGLVSNLFNPNAAQKSTASNYPAESGQQQVDSAQQEPISVQQDNAINTQALSKASNVKPQAVAAVVNNNQPATTQTSSSVNNLMSMFPNFVNQNKQPFATTSAASLSQAQQVAKSDNPTSALTQTSSTPQQHLNPAQQVINQILTAYVSGLIPNELIQVGLSGRVPPQIIELALSGQVPPQIIQMVITGQVPMSTINTFLLPLPPSQSVLPQTALAQTKNSGKLQSTRSSSSSSQGISFSSTTRAIFEAILRRALRDSNGNSSLSNIKLPSLNMKRLGKIVGGTITNVASMLPL